MQDTKSKKTDHTKSKKTDYTKVQLSTKDKLIIIGIAVGITVLIAYLFYESMWAIVVLPVALYFGYRYRVEMLVSKQRQSLTTEFVDFLKNLSASLLAGYSLENAWRETEKELCYAHGPKSKLYLELYEMNRVVSMNEPLEKQLEEFAQRSGIEEIIAFADIFSFAKRSGGNFIDIIETTSSRILEKIETRNEIDVMVSAKKMEQKIMSAVPLGVLLYLKLASPEHMQALYGSLFGVVFMTICLGVYIFGIYLARRVLDIQV